MCTRCTAHRPQIHVIHACCVDDVPIATNYRVLLLCYCMLPMVPEPVLAGRGALRTIYISVSSLHSEVFSIILIHMPIHFTY